MACRCFCCRKPRYRRLVDGLFPADPQEPAPVASEQDKLLYFAQSSPEHLDRIGEYLTLRLRRSLHRDRRGHVQVALKITERLVAECTPQRLRLIAASYLDMLHSLLESPHTDLQILATESFVLFAEREEDSTPYHRQYDFFIHRFASMSLVPKTDPPAYLKTRTAGLKGLQGVIKKMGREEGLQLNIWDLDHMNKIVPAFLFNIQERITMADSEIQSVGEADLVGFAEECLKGLIVCAGLAHIDNVIKPVLQHFDLNDLWTSQRDFASEVFVTVVQTMQKQDRYKAIQALVDHLDTKASESCEQKQGILDTLSRCVAVAADGSLGPSVLDVFRTLVRHLRVSLEGCRSTPTEGSLDSAFQDSITRTMGEFAGVLPDYQKPDIMNLINSYMPDQLDAGQPEHPLQGSGSPLLSASLVKCLRAVADTYHPSVLETTFPEALFTSLVQLLRIRDPETQLDVSVLWHQLIDHHDNKRKLPFNTTWESLKSCGLELGKVSQRFINKTRTSLYKHLYEYAMVLAVQPENVRAFYQLLFLLMLEFSHPGIVDMVQYLCQLQDLAQTTKLEPRHRLALHVTVAGILYLIAKMTSNNTLHDHVVEVIGHRQSSAPYLLPDSLFAAETEPTEPTVEDINPELLFQMKDRGILQLSPEPKHGIVREYSREYSTSEMMTHHFSVSLDYGGSPDSPLSVEQMTFNSFKEKLELIDSTGGSVKESGEHLLTPRFADVVGRSSMQETGLGEVASILAASPGGSIVGQQPRSKSAYDLEMPTLN